MKNLEIDALSPDSSFYDLFVLSKTLTGLPTHFDAPVGREMGIKFKGKKDVFS